MQIYLAYVALAFSFLPVLAGVRKPGALIWILATVGFVSNCLLLFIIKDVMIKMVLGNLYVWAECLLLILIYQHNGLLKNQMLKFFAFCVFIFEIIDTLRTGITHFNGIGTAYLSALYMLLAVSSYVMIIRQQKSVFLEHSAFFWFNTAVIISASGGFILYLFVSYLTEHNMQGVRNSLWFVNNSLDLIKSVLISVALLQKKP